MNHQSPPAERRQQETISRETQALIIALLEVNHDWEPGDCSPAARERLEQRRDSLTIGTDDITVLGQYWREHSPPDSFSAVVDALENWVGVAWIWEIGEDA